MKTRLSTRRAGRLIRVGVALGTLAAGNAAMPLTDASAAATRAVQPAQGEERVILQILYRSPVLVRAGEPVRIPVDVVCGRGAAACVAEATIAVRDGAAGWRSSRVRQVGGLQFDLTAPATRAARAGRLDFRLSARGPDGGTLAVPGRGSLHLYVASRIRSVDLPAVQFGRARTGHTALYLPWGSGPLSAGLAPGDESSTVGPSSFDVDRGGRIYLVDPLRRRMAVFRDGRLLREVPAAVPQRTDVAATRGGSAVLASDVAGPGGREVVVRAIDRAGGLGRPLSLGPGTLAQVRAAGNAAFADVLPLDAWVPLVPGATPGAGGLFAGRPLPGGGLLLRSIVGTTVRLGTVQDGRVRRAVELRSRSPLGELALAEPLGRGFLAVVHVTRPGPVPADQYQVVRVAPDGSVSTFAVANRSFAEPMPLSRFRLGGDGALYQLATSPDGVRVVRYGIGGTR